MVLPYGVRRRLAPYTYRLIALLVRDDDLQNLAKEIRYQSKRNEAELLAEAQTKFKTILNARYLSEA